MKRESKMHKHKIKKIFRFFRKLMIYIVLFFLAFCAIYPLIFLLVGSLKSANELRVSLEPLWTGEGEIAWSWLPWEPTLRHYVELLLDSPGYFVMFWNSVKIVGGVIVGQILLGLPAAGGFARWEFCGRKTLMSLYIVLMLFPFQVLMLSEYLILNQMGWIDTLMALILPGACSTFPVFIMHRFFVKISQDIIEAAELDGASEWQIFLYIGIPLGMPGIMAVIVLTFLEYWNLVEQPAVFLQSDYLKPLSLYILTITKENAGIIFVAATIALLPPLLIFLCGRKYLESGISTLTEKG